MPAFREAAPGELRVPYLRLWQEHKKGLNCFSALDAFFSRLIEGKFLLLRNRFRLRTLQVLRGEEPVLMATLFLPEPGWSDNTIPASIGAFAARSDLHPEESALFWEEVAKRWGHRALVAPMNGHHYLGFALPPPKADASRIGFQTSAFHQGQETLFGPLRSRPAYRNYHSFETTITPSLLERLEEEIREIPRGIRVRAFSPCHARRDFAVLNTLVNVCFTRHFDFAPLSEEENGDIFRFSTPLLPPSHLLFLEDQGKPIGFCFGMRDYNRILTNGPDWKNAGRLLLSRKTPRGRLIHIGLIPEYQGQGLIKHARHRILLAFAREGMTSVENSYVDEGNQNSLGNVRSTGAQPLHVFSLLRAGK